MSLRRMDPVVVLAGTAGMLALAGCAAVPGGGSAAPAPVPTVTPVPAGAAASAASATPTFSAAAGTFQGAGVDMQWGTVQVTIMVKNHKIAAVQATAPMERMRSAFINQQALPMLKSEVLQAQSANIDYLSGATMTSDAYAQSLQDALSQAHLPVS